MKNIIITCGTSLLTNLKKYGQTFTNDEEKIIDKLEKEQTANESLDLDSKIERYLKDYNLKHLSAEIKTVFTLKEKGDINESDNIYLYYSQTEIGKRIADIIKLKLEKQGFNNVKTELIEGFIVKDRGIGNKANKVFKTEGIKNFYGLLEDIKQDYQNQEFIMAPVGGYKALIPYASLYAMVNGWDIKYIYEDSDEMIDLPSGALTNLSSNLILKNKIESDLFSNEHLSLDYSYKQGLDLLFGIKNFINYGKSTDISRVSEELMQIYIDKKDFTNPNKEILEDIYKYLNNLSDAFDLIRKKEILKNIKYILELDLDNIEDIFLKNILQYLKDELEKVIIKKEDDEVDIDIDYLFEWYFRRNRYAELVLLMREGIIDFVGIKLDLGYEKREDRIKIENTLHLFSNKRDANREYLLNYQELKVVEIFKGNEGFFEKLTRARNDFAHINSDINLSTIKNSIKKLYEVYQEIISYTPEFKRSK